MEYLGSESVSEEPDTPASVFYGDRRRSYSRLSHRISRRNQAICIKPHL